MRNYKQNSINNAKIIELRLDLYQKIITNLRTLPLEQFSTETEKLLTELREYYTKDNYQRILNLEIFSDETPFYDQHYNESKLTFFDLFLFKLDLDFNIYTNVSNYERVAPLFKILLDNGAQLSTFAKYFHAFNAFPLNLQIYTNLQNKLLIKEKYTISELADEIAILLPKVVSETIKANFPVANLEMIAVTKKNGAKVTKELIENQINYFCRNINLNDITKKELERLILFQVKLNPEYFSNEIKAYQDELNNNQNQEEAESLTSNPETKGTNIININSIRNSGSNKHHSTKDDLSDLGSLTTHSSDTDSQIDKNNTSNIREAAKKIISLTSGKTRATADLVQDKLFDTLKNFDGLKEIDNIIEAKLLKQDLIFIPLNKIIQNILGEKDLVVVYNHPPLISYNQVISELLMISQLNRQRHNLELLFINGKLEYPLYQNYLSNATINIFDGDGFFLSFFMIHALFDKNNLKEWHEKGFKDKSNIVAGVLGSGENIQSFYRVFFQSNNENLRKLFFVKNKKIFEDIDNNDKRKQAQILKYQYDLNCKINNGQISITIPEDIITSVDNSSLFAANLSLRHRNIIQVNHADLKQPVELAELYPKEIKISNKKSLFNNINPKHHIYQLTQGNLSESERLKHLTVYAKDLIDYDGFISYNPRKPKYRVSAVQMELFYSIARENIEMENKEKFASHIGAIELASYFFDICKTHIPNLYLACYYKDYAKDYTDYFGFDCSLLNQEQFYFMTASILALSSILIISSSHEVKNLSLILTPIITPPIVESLIPCDGAKMDGINFTMDGINFTLALMITSFISTAYIRSNICHNLSCNDYKNKTAEELIAARDSNRNSIIPFTPNNFVTDALDRLNQQFNPTNRWFYS